MAPSPFLKVPFTGVDGVKAISQGHPVYLLLLDDGSHLVIKREDSVGARVDLAHNIKMMKTVSPAAAGKILVATELQVLNDFLRDSAIWATRVRKPEPPDCGALRADIAATTARSQWFKMENVAGFMNLIGALNAMKDDGDKSGIRAIAKALNAPNGFERLGHVVAADLYNNNIDRFALNSAAGAREATFDDRLNQKYRVLSNIGNVIFFLDGKILTPVGLDSFDPTNSDFSVVNDAIEQNEYAASGIQWFGRILANNPTAKKRRADYAQDIYDDLSDALGPRNRKFAFLNSKRLDANGPKRIVKGMEDATIKLRAKLTLLVNRPNAPAGLRSRLVAMS